MSKITIDSAPQLKFMMTKELDTPRLFEAEKLGRKASGHFERFSIHKHFEIFRKGSENIIYAIDGNDGRVVGVLIQLTTSDEYFPETLGPNFIEENFDLDKLLETAGERQYNVHIPTVVIDEDHPNRLEILSGLAKKFISFHKAKMLKNSKLIKISGASDSLFGDYFARLIGLKPHGANSRGVRIMLCANFSAFVYQTQSTPAERQWIVQNVLRNVAKI